LIAVFVLPPCTDCEGRALLDDVVDTDRERAVEADATRDADEFAETDAATETELDTDAHSETDEEPEKEPDTDAHAETDEEPEKEPVTVDVALVFADGDERADSDAFVLADGEPDTDDVDDGDEDALFDFTADGEVELERVPLNGKRLGDALADPDLATLAERENAGDGEKVPDTELDTDRVAAGEHVDAAESPSAKQHAVLQSVGWNESGGQNEPTGQMICDVEPKGQ
jgi:hypothetical protein